MAEGNNSDVNVVVVGAGIAGLSAASKLYEEGLDNVTVLEAQDRIGGRIHTVNFGDNVLELGGQWIHGIKDNAVYQLAKKHNLVDDTPEVMDSPTYHWNSDFEGCHFITSKGEHVERVVVNQMLSLFENIYEEADEFFSSDSDSEGDTESSSEEENSPFNAREMFPCGQTPESYGEFFDTCLQQVLQKCENEASDYVMLKKAFCEWEKQIQFADNACSSLHSIGLKGWGKYFECEGDVNIEFKNGFKSLLDVILNKMPPKAFILSKPVKTIHWQTSSDRFPNQNASEQTTKTNKQTPVQNEDQTGSNKQTSSRSVVECEDGSRFEADYIIITPSLGVLQEREATLFAPMLPESKRNALKNVEFGTVDKIFLEWETRFWDENCYGFQFLWLENAPVVVKSDKCDKLTKSGKPWYHNFQGFEMVLNQPNVLLAFISGENAEIQESLDDDEVMNVCVEILAFFTKMDIPRPKKLLRSSWKRNPYIRGSYSLLTPNTQLVEHDSLQEPLPSKQHPVLLFAGEAYSKHHFTASHGAMETGLSAAATILKDLKK